MSTEHDDLALTALLTAAKEVNCDLTEDFIKRSYAIQRSHQFDQDQTTSLHDLEKLVDDHLSKGDAV